MGKNNKKQFMTGREYIEYLDSQPEDSKYTEEEAKKMDEEFERAVAENLRRNKTRPQKSLLSKFQKK